MSSSLHCEVISRASGQFGSDFMTFGRVVRAGQVCRSIQHGGPSPLNKTKTRNNFVGLSVPSLMAAASGERENRLPRYFWCGLLLSAFTIFSRHFFSRHRRLSRHSSDLRIAEQLKPSFLFLCHQHFLGGRQPPNLMAILHSLIPLSERNGSSCVS